MLAPRDVSTPDGAIHCEKVASHNEVWLGRLAYKQVLRFLLEVGELL